jgi:hypothetical protein
MILDKVQNRKTVFSADFLKPGNKGMTVNVLIQPPDSCSVGFIIYAQFLNLEHRNSF